MVHTDATEDNLLREKQLVKQFIGMRWKKTNSHKFTRIEIRPSILWFVVFSFQTLIPRRLSWNYNARKNCILNSNSRCQVINELSNVLQSVFFCSLCYRPPLGCLSGYFVMTKLEKCLLHETELSRHVSPSTNVKNNMQ